MDGAKMFAGGDCAYWDQLEEGAFGFEVEGWDGRGWAVRIAKSNSPIFSLIFSKTGQIGISYFFPRGMERRSKTSVSSKPYFADRLFDMVFRGGGGSGVIVQSLFECPGCPESSDLISDGTAYLDNSSCGKQGIST